MTCGSLTEGEANPGERLPPAKDLAAILGVKTNTVLRSLRLLRDEGLLEFRRGRGISVVGTPERGAVVQRARDLVEFARHHGYRMDELVEIVEAVRSRRSRSSLSPGERGWRKTKNPNYWRRDDEREVVARKYERRAQALRVAL